MAKPAVAVPTPEQVTVYLTAHKLETAIEEAVNDAVLKQVRVCDAMPQTPVGARALPQCVISHHPCRLSHAESIQAHC